MVYISSILVRSKIQLNVESDVQTRFMYNKHSQRKKKKKIPAPKMNPRIPKTHLCSGMLEAQIPVHSVLSKRHSKIVLGSTFSSSFRPNIRECCRKKCQVLLNKK